MPGLKWGGPLAAGGEQSGAQICFMWGLWGFQHWAGTFLGLWMKFNSSTVVVHLGSFSSQGLFDSVGRHF